jgi:hypothetical protein
MSKSPSLPIEAILELAKSVRDEAKPEHAPNAVAQALGSAIREQIAQHQAELVKMRTLEVTTLKKSHEGLAKEEVKFSSEWKTKKDSNGKSVRSQVGTASHGTYTVHDRSAHGAGFHAVYNPHQLGGWHGGPMHASTLSEAHALAHAHSAEAAGKTVGAKAAGTVSEAGSVGKSETTVFTILAKGDFGMGDGGKVATTPQAAAAAPAGPKPKFTIAHIQAAKQALVAGGVKPMTSLGAPKAPTAPVMPSAPTGPGGKFGKREFEGEHCPYCKHSLSKCNCA